MPALPGRMRHQYVPPLRRWALAPLPRHGPPAHRLRGHQTVALCRHRRRWLNDRLLRDMAGALTAADMASLFAPVPFGEPRRSVFDEAARGPGRELWELFRPVLGV